MRNRHEAEARAQAAADKAVSLIPRGSRRSDQDSIDEVWHDTYDRVLQQEMDAIEAEMDALEEEDSGYDLLSDL